MNIGEFLDRLGIVAPWTDAAGWDPSGLQLGDPAVELRRVGVCHEVTDVVVTAVESEPVDLLVTYHPLLFRPTTRLVAGPSPRGRAWRLARAGVCLAVAHTSFDVAPGGVADALADAVGLVDTEGFGVTDPAEQVKVVTFVPAEAVETVAAAMAAAGGGVIGTYSACSFRTEGTGAFVAGEGSAPVVGRLGAPSREPEVRIEMVAPAARRERVVAALVAAHPYERPAYDVYPVTANAGFVGRVGDLPSEVDLADFAAEVTERLGDGSRVSGSGPMRRVAVVPGSGSSLIEAAAAAGADVLVTGDVSHHRMVEAADLGLAVVDVGHAPSERPGMAVLRRAVATAAGEAELVDLTGYDPTPWR